MSCQVCNERASIYRCPGCSVRFCCVDCCRRHKLETKCNGKRDRTGFEPVSAFDDTKLLSGTNQINSMNLFLTIDCFCKDYLFLEDVAREHFAAARALSSSTTPQNRVKSNIFDSHALSQSCFEMIHI